MGREILKKISQRKIVEDEYISNITLQNLLDEIIRSFRRNFWKRLF